MSVGAVTLKKKSVVESAFRPRMEDCLIKNKSIADAVPARVIEAAKAREASRVLFSSRRRHTRLQGDWSSDVCSSDLIALVGVLQGIRFAAGDAYWTLGRD